MKDQTKHTIKKWLIKHEQDIISILFVATIISVAVTTYMVLAM